MKGIIYKITCNETGEIYYGSTQCSLNKRITEHKCTYKRWKEGNKTFCSSFPIIERGTYSYSLIENVVCEDRKQLETRERFYIENNECINKYVPTRTTKEYYEETKEARLDYQKQYYEANKQRIIQLYRQQYHNNKDHINELRRQRRAKAKELLNNNKLVEVNTDPTLSIPVQC